MATIWTSVIITYICITLVVSMLASLFILIFATGRADSISYVVWSALGLLAAIALQLYGGW